MKHNENLLAVRRQLLPEQHEALLGRIPYVKESCGNLRMTWFELGTAVCTHIERSEYRDALASPGGVLQRQDVSAVAQGICSMLTETPTGGDTLEATVSDINFTNHGKSLRIAYILDSPELIAENQQLRDYIDEENQSENDWPPFIPMIRVAMIKRQDASDDVLEAVWQIGQPSFTLLPPAPVLIDP